MNRIKNLLLLITSALLLIAGCKVTENSTLIPTDISKPTEPSTIVETELSTIVETELCYCGEHYVNDILMQPVPPLNIHALIPQYQYPPVNFPQEVHSNKVSNFVSRFETIHTVDYITWESDWYDTIIVWSDTPLRDFSFLALYLDEDFTYSVREALVIIDELLPTEAVVINVNFAHERSYCGGFVFTDENNLQNKITLYETAHGGCGYRYVLASRNEAFEKY